MTARRRRSGEVAAAATVLALLVGVAACGIPADSKPQALARKDVPFDLLAPSTTIAAPAPGTRVPLNVYLVGINGLVPVTRGVRAPAMLAGALSALQAGPTDAEVTNGLRTSIPPQTSLSAGPVGFGLGTVELGSSFGQVGGQEQILAVAQIVFTATSVPGIGGVLFTIGGRPVEVPVGDGTLTQGPLGRSDFPSLGR